MKVLGIACSPRLGGNTDILVKEALAEAARAGAETELVRVAEKNIAPCDGCMACAKTGICKIKDDMQGVYAQLEAADGIILGTPVYFLGVSAQGKAFMDRTYAHLRVRKLRGKVAAAIVAVRRIGGGQVLSSLYSFFTLHRMVIAGGGVGYGLEKGDVMAGVGAAPGLSALDEARGVGRNVVWMVERLARGKG